jgi:hypothetical protein
MTRNEYLNLVNTAIQKVKQFPITTIKKKDHISKLYELKNLYDRELMPVNRLLFDAEYTFEWKQYKINLEIGKSKKELDANLKYCLTVIFRQLQSIKQDINLIEGLID